MVKVTAKAPNTHTAHVGGNYGKKVTNMAKQAKTVKAPAITTGGHIAPAQVNAVGTTYVVYGSKRQLTGNPHNWGTATETLSKNANAMWALRAAADANGGTITQAQGVQALQGIAHKASFFGYALRRGWLAVAPSA